MTTKLNLALSSDFLASFSKLPKHVQAKTNRLICKFRQEPFSSGLNLEKLHKTKDPNLYSIRIGDDYRGILFKQTGNKTKKDVYVLLWVDHHDDAYDWAKNRICTIHPEIGSLQILEVAGIQKNISVDKTRDETDIEKKKNLFLGIRDRDMVKLGVPEVLLPLLRSINSDGELDRVASRFPQEASDALYLLASGCSLEETWREMMITDTPDMVDTSDVMAALNRPESKQRFIVVDDDLELQAILNAPLDKWRVFLHPSQRKLVERNWNGSIRVLGGAGTGKTVAAVHRARWLAKNIFNRKNDRILFTTFTRNLAADIEVQLQQICDPDIKNRIEVVNIDRWVTGFLRRQGYNYRIAYGQEAEEAWNQALTIVPVDLPYSEGFYRDELEQIILSRGIDTLQQYIHTPRIGRGIRLSRQHRKLIWPVFEEYRLSLRNRRLKARDDAIRDARQILFEKKDLLPYQSVVVDEAQDMGEQSFKLIRAIVGDEKSNDLFIAGDAHQRIYNRKVVLRQCGINIVGRSRKLRINYRTTEETRRWSIALLKGIEIDDLDGGGDDHRGVRSLTHGAPPEICIFDDFPAEVTFLLQRLSTLNSSELAATCVVARTSRLLSQYEGALKAAGISVYYIKSSEAEDRKAPGIRMATMHRIKGLEFERMFIVGVNRGVIPIMRYSRNEDDQIAKHEHLLRERALLYVAATRAKQKVMVSCYGEISQFLAYLFDM